MNALTALCSLALVGCGNALALVLQRWQPPSAWRREAHVFVLASPLVGLVVGLTSVHNCARFLCLSPEASRGTLLSTLILLAMISALFIALALNVLRLLVLLSIARRNTRPAGPTIQQTADRLASRLGIRQPRILVRSLNRPLAVTFGWMWPTVLLSSWMLEHLDSGELEAVLAHEVSHAARHDFALMWLATALRDAFWYLPASHEAHRRLAAEKELATDELAVAITRRPLGLASALAKVWQAAVDPPSFAFAPALAADPACLEGRIARLVGVSAPDVASIRRATGVHLHMSVAVVAGLLLGAAGGVTLLLGLMGCGPLGMA